MTKARFKRIRMLAEFDMPTYESEQSQGQLEGDIQQLVNCDPYISPSFVTTEGMYLDKILHLNTRVHYYCHTSFHL